tara:strand:- start:7552 stop:8031 length:480 start_codon:yes stop_codon:yes gene_type:complete
MKKKTKKKILISIGSIFIIGISIVLYLLFAPHRDTQASPIDFRMTVTELVNESLENSKATNDKYLSEDGDSKIIAISGSVASVEMDFVNNQVVRLKEEGDDAGVKCTFMKNTNKNAVALSVGDKITIKGVYRVAASYDEDFEEYEDVIVEECDILRENS